MEGVNDSSFRSAEDAVSGYGRSSLVCPVCHFYFSLLRPWTNQLPRFSVRLNKTHSSEPIAAFVFMGKTGAGKSSMIRLLGGKGRDGAEPIVDDGLESCRSLTLGDAVYLVAYRSAHTDPGTAGPTIYETTIDGRMVLLLDTPGFDDSEQSNLDILREIVSNLYLFALKRTEVEVRGVIFLHDITETRLSGSQRITWQILKAICGEESMKNVLVGTTQWSSEGDRRFQNEESREKELSDKHWNGIYKSSRVIFEDKENALQIIRDLLVRPPVLLLVQTEMITPPHTVEATTAGRTTMPAAFAEMERLQKEMAGQQRKNEEETCRTEEAYRKEKEAQKRVQEEEHIKQAEAVQRRDEERLQEKREREEAQKREEQGRRLRHEEWVERQAEEAQKRAQAEEAQRRVEAEEHARQQEVARIQAEEEQRKREDERQKKEQEQRRCHDEEMKRQAEEAQRLAQVEEARRRAEEETYARQQKEALRQAEAARIQAEEEEQRRREYARQKEEQEQRTRYDEEIRRQAEVAQAEALRLHNEQMQRIEAEEQRLEEERRQHEAEARAHEEERQRQWEAENNRLKEEASREQERLQREINEANQRVRFQRVCRRWNNQRN